MARTLARQNLALAHLPGLHSIQDTLSYLPSVQHRNSLRDLPPGRLELTRQYRRLSLRDIFLSFPAYRPSGHPVHRAIAALSPGDSLVMRSGPKRWELLDRDGTVVGQLASNFAPPDGMHCTSATVLAIVTWDKEKSEPQFQGNFRCENWEVVVPELVFEPERQSAN